MYQRIKLTLLALALGATGPALAGDAATGEAAFRQCKSCHKIASAEEMFVRGGPTGPNLYGVIGRQAGTEDFRYGADLVRAGEAGLVWNEENLAEYITDPRAFLREYLDDPSAKVKMTFKSRKDQADIATFLATFSDDPS
ncbi:cytochrome c family protein [Pseudooceanicola sp. HF7]|uniref:c-type cytochrome n=1 Tax=Pseudooceanicola sp. HF7 TaxID=2721560 RepID=UPI0014314EF1|nr:c-type cytochrome [Pseudooceanicola sp. HF7]NIZ09952.1 c-type cytochrome [Pseudooceanicola sp. HF7]